MVIDFDFYKNIYGGNKLTEDNFNKFINKSFNIISQYTFDRVNDDNISKFPPSLIDKIQKCACELAEYEYDVNRLNNLMNINESGTNGIVKNITAGAVSKSYDTTAAINNLIGSNSGSSGNNRGYYSNIKKILNVWLYPQYIDRRYYNLLSWVQ